MDVHQFEQWVYQNLHNLEHTMPEALYQKTLLRDFKNLTNADLYDLKQDLKQWIDQQYPRRCHCLT